MTGEESVFFCIKRQDAPEEAARPLPPPAPPPVPPPVPHAGPSPKQYEDLCSKLTALEAKVVKLEEISSASATAAAGSKAETQAAQLRCAGLEREVAGLKKLIEASVPAGRDAVSTAIGQFSSLHSISLSVSLFEGRLKNIETGLANELKERFLMLDASFGETARKAGLAQETAAGSARRVEKMEERLARLPYLENRVNAGAEKLERIYELEALTQSLKLSVEGMEKHFDAAMRDSAITSAEHKKICSDFESLSHNVSHLAALFNQIRTELAFLMPKRQESPGGQGRGY